MHPAPDTSWPHPGGTAAGADPAPAFSPDHTHPGGYHVGPGPRRSNQWWLWPLMLFLLGTLIFLQRPESADPADVQAQVSGLNVGEADSPEVVLFGKLILAIRQSKHFK